MRSTKKFITPKSTIIPLNQLIKKLENGPLLGLSQGRQLEYVTVSILTYLYTLKRLEDGATLILPLRNFLRTYETWLSQTQEKSGLIGTGVPLSRESSKPTVSQR